MLKLKQSNINCVLSETSPGANACNVKVTFPNFTTGRFEVQIHKSSDTGGIGFGAPTFTGNVTAVNDLWDASSYSHRTLGGSAGVHSTGIVHVDVRPATAGVDNSVTLVLT